MFVIAAHFFTGSALAHMGHGHGHSAASHSPGIQLSEHASPSTRSTVQLAKLEQTDPSLSMPEGADMAVIPHTGGCTGSCCGNGIGCCGAVLAVAPSLIPERQPQQKTVAFALDSQSGIDPEGLRRPPRTLA